MTQISENTTIGLFKVKSKNAFFEKQGVFLLALNSLIKQSGNLKNSGFFKN
jgi:hypothetical protein